jgi:hypothetical protein
MVDLSIADAIERKGTLKSASRTPDPAFIISKVPCMTHTLTKHHINKLFIH